MKSIDSFSQIQDINVGVKKLLEASMAANTRRATRDPEGQRQVKRIFSAVIPRFALVALIIKKHAATAGVTLDLSGLDLMVMLGGFF